MNKPDSDSPDQRACHDAAEWLAKHDRGLTATEQDEFFQWLAGDARRGTWFSRHREGWNRLDRISHWRPKHGSEPNHDVLAQPFRRTRWMRSSSLIAAAAAMVIVAATVYLRSFRVQAVPVAMAHVGAYEQRTLEDGTVVALNEGAELEIGFTPAERRVSLVRGEALFTVTKNPQRPFIVHAAGIDVRAVGTEFNVRLANSAVEVLVTEGKVEVAPLLPSGQTEASLASPPVHAFVGAGESTTVPLAGNSRPAVVRTSDADRARLNAWQPQLLDFSSTPLAQVLAEFNRRNRVKLVLADTSSAQVPIVASIRSDNVEGFVSLVATAVGLHAERKSEYEIILHPDRTKSVVSSEFDSRAH